MKTSEESISTETTKRIGLRYALKYREEHDPQTKHTDPGPFPFSEIETQVVRDELREFKPNAFLSIHSGTLGLFSPYAYAKEQRTVG